MKRLWLVFLSLGLVLAFSASAMAVDVKFSGSFEAAGMYLDKTSVNKYAYDGGSADVSTAFYYQRLRVQTDFIISPGLKLVTRFDAMERIWGGARSTVPLETTQDSQSAGTRAENQNIAFDWAYIEYASPIGIFQAGYGPDNYWGTVFGDSKSGAPAGQISYMLPIKDFLVGAMIFKEGELSRTSVTSSTTIDSDVDKYILWGMYNINKDINVGLLYVYVRNASGRAASYPNGSLTTLNILEPYVKAKFGPVSVEAELDYAWGKTKAEDGVIGSDVDIQSLMAYVNAVADFGMVYAGGTFAYISGDDPNTTDKLEGGILDGGMDWNPCLIMFNQDITYWAGAINGYGVTSNSSPMRNAWFGQGKVGVRPIDKLDIMASLSYATADKKPTGVLNSTYGWEIDVTGTYKLTNNLSYMLGVGYLFTGDYYKGDSNANSVNNNYMLINKLTLTF